MAIIGPADLPSVLKVDSTPIKKYILSQLGHPHVSVELSEDQWETVLKTAGDFIAGYFPREQKMAVFNTQPFKSTYPMPADAYWIKDVAWDPVTTRIGDIFSAESFLFSFPGGTQVLTTEGPRTCEDAAKNPKTKLVTPFGPRKPMFRWNAHKQPIQIVQTENDYLACTPNHPVNIEQKFRMAVAGYPGLHLLDSKDKPVEIIGRDNLHTDGVWSVVCKGSGCFYVSATGKQFFLVH